MVAMSFQVKEPVLVIGLGGVGSKLAIEAKNALNSDCLIISNSEQDLKDESNVIKISTESVANPSVQLIRGAVFKVQDQIKSKISQYSTVILMANLAGKSGSAIAPVAASMCKELEKNTIAFTIMPFKYEKDRIFNSGLALKRVRAEADCTVVLDNDSLLESNPDLSAKSCYSIANSAIMHVVNSLNESEISEKTNILTTSKSGQNIEESLRDSIKMLYEDAPPNTVRRSILYVAGGDNIPVGIMNSISNITRGITEDNAQIDMKTTTSDESKIVMLSSIQGMTKFERYDPLGMISQENTLDWSEPECSINCNLDLYQLE